MASVALEPKLNFTVMPGWAASKVLPSSVKVPVREAAANTISSVAAGALAAGAPEEAEGAAAVPLVSLVSLVPHADAAKTTAMSNPDTRLNKGASY
ncbi:hypothetical protein Acor_35080 [Acrocarpospora corrugata]|uniref:Uncharacterized protein n=1 Tax=Acrocarpospora corrugata TaxID=35763 RepID=A0A5M3VYC4_9ACTN|nr:hypothetical protein Acor_35080 [Acrocarpospora corrugata]